MKRIISKINNCNNTIFQHNSKSPIVKTNDIKILLSKTIRMKNETRKKFFIKKGINLDNSLKYIDIVDKLETLYNRNDLIYPKEETINYYGSSPLIINTEDQNLFIAGQRALCLSGIQIFKHALNITVLFFIMIYISYVINTHHLY